VAGEEAGEAVELRIPVQVDAASHGVFKTPDQAGWSL
jgi:hypothetical protein